MQKQLFAALPIAVEPGHVRYLSGEMGEFTLRWLCPGCGGETAQLVEHEGAIRETKSEIENDPLCYRCRKPK